MIRRNGFSVVMETHNQVKALFVLAIAGFSSVVYGLLHDGYIIGVVTSLLLYLYAGHQIDKYYEHRGGQQWIGTTLCVIGLLGIALVLAYHFGFSIKSWLS